MRVLSVWNNKKKEHDSANLHALMSVPITCTLPLTDVLKVGQEVMGECSKEVTRCWTVEQGANIG